MPPGNIALVGFMGAGKSTIGRALAVRLGRSFIETDALVEQRASMSVADVFAQRGEAYFRELEAEVVREVCGCQECVIACGGGVVLRQENVTALKAACVLVYLEVSASSVLRRLGSQSTVRPLLQGPDRETRVKELMELRRPVYETVADITVRTDGLLVEQIVRKVQRRLMSR